MKMGFRSEKIGVIYSTGSKILAVQVKNGKTKVVNGEIDNIDQANNSVSIKDSQSGSTIKINMEEIKSLKLTEESLNNSFALSRWYKHPDGTFQMHPPLPPAPAREPEPEPEPAVHEVHGVLLPSVWNVENFDFIRPVDYEFDFPSIIDKHSLSREIAIILHLVR